LVFFFPFEIWRIWDIFFSLKILCTGEDLFFSGQNLGKFRPEKIKWSIYVIFDLLIGILDLVKYLVKYVTTPW